MLKIEVGSVSRDTLFVVVPTKASYNLLLGRDWIHALGAIPSTANQKLVIWNNLNKVEVVEADDSPCYMQQLHVDFKVYDPKVKPIRLDAENFDKVYVNKCLMENYGITLVEEAVEQRLSTSQND
ncbi:MAG: hypothetical protein Q8877_03585 [Sweet potato little leaf phytoplasma]|nr:hypothetical protein [Sweet potato little leaf phytoplasma]